MKTEEATLFRPPCSTCGWFVKERTENVEWTEGNKSFRNNILRGAHCCRFPHPESKQPTDWCGEHTIVCGGRGKRGY